MACRLELDNKFWDEYRSTSPLVQKLSVETLKTIGSQEGLKNFDMFLENFQKKNKPLNSELQAWLDRLNKNLSALDSCKHIFAKINYGGFHNVKKREG